MKFARFDIDRPPGPDTVTLRAKLKGAQGFAKQVELLVLSASAPREAVDRFLQGGARLAELADGNLLQVLEVGHEQGRAFLATEASAGEPLSKLLEKCKERGLESMPAPLALGIGAELAKALAHAHAHSDSNTNPDPVTHGALRSEAITVGEDGAVKLGGFVPWRAAPSVEDDLEKLVELVSTWVTAGDQKLVRESAGGLTSAGDLRKAWSAYQALQWPGLAPDARRTWVSFAKGEATKLTLESKLGARPTKVAVPKWGFAVAAGAAALVAVALLWPSQEPNRVPEVALPPKPKPKKAPEAPQAYSRTVEVDGEKAHLELPNDLPGVVFKNDHEFNETDLHDAHVPQLFVVTKNGSSRTFATVPVTQWVFPGARELQFFSWDPFEGRFRPGLRMIDLHSTKRKFLPLVQPWLEVQGEGVHLSGLPPHRALVVTATLVGDGPAHGPLLAAISYGQTAPRGDDPDWPYSLTRLVLKSGQTSPTLDDAQELAFITTDPADHYTVTVDEGANSRAELWPRGRAVQLEADPGKIVFRGRYDGFETPGAVELMSGCSIGRVDRECIDRCIAGFKQSYFCWRYFTEQGRKSAERVKGAEMFVRLACGEPEHPWCTAARDVIATEQEKALLAPIAPANP